MIMKDVCIKLRCPYYKRFPGSSGCTWQTNAIVSLLYRFNPEPITSIELHRIKYDIPKTNCTHYKQMNMYKKLINV